MENINPDSVFIGTASNSTEKLCFTIDCLITFHMFQL